NSIYNVFIANTPFQMYVIDILIGKYFQRNKNIVFSTSTGRVKSTNNYEIVYIDRDFIRSVRGTIAFKKRIDEILEYNPRFFLPHVNNLLSYYCYQLAQENSKLGINIYYEGVALFYDPRVPIKMMTIIKRKILSTFLRLKYKYCSALFPPQLREIATAYSPMSSFTSSFKNIVEFDFPTNAEVTVKLAEQTNSSLE